MDVKSDFPSQTCPQKGTAHHSKLVACVSGGVEDEGCLRKASSLLSSVFFRRFLIKVGLQVNCRARVEPCGRFGHALLGRVVNGAKL